MGEKTFLMKVCGKKKMHNTLGYILTYLQQAEQEKNEFHTLIFIVCHFLMSCVS